MASKKTMEARLMGLKKQLYKLKKEKIVPNGE